MSAIFACFNPATPVAQAMMTKMLSASDYWQPDAISHAVSHHASCRVAKAALFNTERSKRDEACRDEQGNLIAANARLDNRDALAAELGIAGEDLASMADGSLILAAYRCWGENSPEHLLGDFAFVIWDEIQQSFFAARDHFGVKVLFYGMGKHGFIVTNEHNAFFSSGSLNKEIREEWLVEKLWHAYEQPFESPYRGIMVLPPAHSLSLGADVQPHLRRFWSLQEKSDWHGMDDAALIEELKQRFRRAVEVRLDSAFPVAAELSEGLDSNGIAGIVAQIHNGQPLMTLSYDCVEPGTDQSRPWEKSYQEIFEMLALYPDLLQPIWDSACDAQAIQEKDCELLRHHFGGVMAINGMHFLRSRVAHDKGARVLLSGFGGDQCVSSKGIFFESELLQQGRWGAVHRLIKARHQRGSGGKPFHEWMHLLLKHFVPATYRWLLHHGPFRSIEKQHWRRSQRSILDSRWLEHYGFINKLRRLTYSYRRNSVREHHHWSLYEMDVGERLVESELAGRMYRIEQRFPMLDVPLVEMAYNMPSRMKMHGGIERYMFRLMLEGLTTQRIQWRLKQDMHFPAINRKASLRSRLKQLSLQLEGSDIALRYCCGSMLESKAAGKTPIWMQEIRGLQLLLSIDEQTKQGNTTIVEPCAVSNG